MFATSWPYATLRTVGQITFFSLDASRPEGRLAARPNTWRQQGWRRPGRVYGGDSFSWLRYQTSKSQPPGQLWDGSQTPGRESRLRCLPAASGELRPELSPEMPSLRVCATNAHTLSTTWPPASDGSHPGDDATRFKKVQVLVGTLAARELSLIWSPPPSQHVTGKQLLASQHSS